jgi:hypothetical protein
VERCPLIRHRLRTPQCARFKHDCRVYHEHAAWTRKSECLDGPSWSWIPVSGLISYPWEQNTRWGSRKYFVRSALLEATADRSVVSTQGRLMLRESPLQMHVRRKPWGRNKGREDQLCIKSGCRLRAIIAGQACDLGFWHPDTDDAVGTQVHCLGVMREDLPQHAWRLALVQVQGVTDVW